MSFHRVKFHTLKKISSTFPNPLEWIIYYWLPRCTILCLDSLTASDILICYKWRGTNLMISRIWGSHYTLGNKPIRWWTGFIPFPSYIHILFLALLVMLWNFSFFLSANVHTWAGNGRRKVHLWRLVLKPTGKASSMCTMLCVCCPPYHVQRVPCYVCCPPLTTSNVYPVMCVLSPLPRPTCTVMCVLSPLPRLTYTLLCVCCPPYHV